MKMELTALILSQAKTFAVMLAAGILTESMWRGKRFLQRRIAMADLEKSAVQGDASREDITKGTAKGSAKKSVRILGMLVEIAFWAGAAAALSGFLYYCAYGKPSLHAAAGFFIGLLLWKKILSYAILRL